MRPSPHRLKARAAIADLIVEGGRRKLAGRALAVYVEMGCPWIAPWPRRVWAQERRKIVGRLRRGRDDLVYSGALPFGGGET